MFLNIDLLLDAVLNLVKLLFA